MKRALTAGPRFQVQEAAALIGTTARRLEGWVEQGFIEPAIRGRGKGSRHRFDLANLVEGVVLLEVQELLGQKSPHPGALMGLVRASSSVLAEGIWDEVTASAAFLVITHLAGGGHLVDLSWFNFAEGAGSPDDFRALTIVNLGGPLSGLGARLAESGNP